MKNLFLVMLLALFAFTSCSKEDDGNKDIVLTGGTATTQTVYADQTSGAGNGIKFNATAPWTATVSAVASKAGGSDLDWLTLNTYSGGAGEHTLTMTLKANTTGADRKAQISIVCGGTTITISVEQKGTTQSGDKPEAPKLVSKIIQLNGHVEDKDVTIFTYDDQNRIKTISEDKSSTISYTYLGNKITETVDQIDRTIYTINTDGFIVEYNESGDNGTFTYDNNGYWTESIYISGDKDKLVWENENLKSEQAFLVSHNEEGYWGTLHAYEYGVELNNCSGNMDVARMIFGTDFDLGAFDYFGKRTKNLPVKEVGSQDKWNKDNGTYTYRYEKNKEGNITKIYATYQPEGESVQPEFLIYEIQYK